MSRLPFLPRIQRRMMKKNVQKSKDKGFCRRLTAILMLYSGLTVTAVAEHLCAARSSVGRWINLFIQLGEAGLISRKPGRSKGYPVQAIQKILRSLVESSPLVFGWLRSRWSVELLVLALSELFGITFNKSTIYRLIRLAGIVWRRAVPTVNSPDPLYNEKVLALRTKLLNQNDENLVFYEDEVDIDFNPKIGADWQLKGEQKQVITPGINQKNYFAGVLNAKTGEVHYVSDPKKNTGLFISMLEYLNQHYSHKESVTLILDNYSIHKSKKVRIWLEKHPSFHLLFLPAYSPWLNKIELLWKVLHEYVTRNHQCRFMWQLLEQVRNFLDSVSPFGRRA
ncbi:TPA: IS630 family transposase [Salmonella enterica subsp. enterica serovar 13,23:b:-]